MRGLFGKGACIWAIKQGTEQFKLIIQFACYSRSDNSRRVKHFASEDIFVSHSKALVALEKKDPLHFKKMDRETIFANLYPLKLDRVGN